MEKNINCFCYCSRPLSSKKKLDNGQHYDIVVIYPCEHLIHISCINYSWNFCPYCLIKITQYISYKQIKYELLWNNKKEYYQIYVDISAIYNLTKLGKINYGILISRVPEISKLLFKFNSITTDDEIKIFMDSFFELLNIKLKIKNKNKLYPGKKIIICNHTTCFDPFFIYYFTGCGFLSNMNVLNKFGIKHILDLVPIILIKRGQQKNTVEKIKKFLNHNNSICIFPEGIITHPKTIAKFRTGAFYAGFPVQPVIIKYSPNFYDHDYFASVLKLMSQEELTITIEILDLENPEFNNKKIEQIRNKMAVTGNFAMSRISNRDVID